MKAELFPAIPKLYRFKIKIKRQESIKTCNISNIKSNITK